MLNKSIQKYKLKLKDLQRQNQTLDNQIVLEDNLYLESKQKLEQEISDEIKVENLAVNMLTYTPDLSVIKDQDIQKLITKI
jgi:ABC-type lipoprotein release transport system permease subunit